jgi:uncharacterized protein (DUF697 family)
MGTLARMANPHESGAEEASSKLYDLVQATTMKAPDVKRLVDGFFQQAKREQGRNSLHAQQSWVAEKITSHFAKRSATSGGVTALAGVIPGVGTVAAAIGGGLADAAICMKLQVDMCLCLAETFGYDVSREESRRLAWLIAAGGSLEKTGAKVTVSWASRAGVRMVREWAKGPSLHIIKEMFKRLGMSFSRKALEKALPFGIGVALGSSFNYALSKYVGNMATRWFTIDRDERLLVLKVVRVVTVQELFH